MMRSMWTAVTGMSAQQLNIDTISNNLANVGTDGFKKSRADFEDLLYQTLKPTTGAGTSETDVQTPVGIQVGVGVRAVSNHKLFNSGNLKQTNSELDVAIEGEGFFQIRQPSGEIAYSRTGAFKKDNTGRIVTAEGLPLEPEIIVPQDATSVIIAKDGTVSAILAGNANQPVNIGNIQLVRFINNAGLNAVGGNLYKFTDASGAPQLGAPSSDGFGALSQGTLETSNVNVAEEMVNMIIAQRAFELNSKAITTSDEMMQTANGLKR